MKTERWVSIPGYEGLYEISSLGSVRSLDRVDRRCECGRPIRTIKGKNLSLVIGTSGYPRVTLCKNGKTKQHLVHRLVLEAFIGAQPDGMECCHNNGKRDDPSLVNLRWDTRKGNHSDRRRHRTLLLGVNTNSAKLNPDAVRKIRASNLSYSEIGQKFGIHPETVYKIKNRITWKEVL